MGSVRLLLLATRPLPNMMLAGSALPESHNECKRYCAYPHHCIVPTYTIAKALLRPRSGQTCDCSHLYSHPTYLSCRNAMRVIKMRRFCASLHESFVIQLTVNPTLIVWAIEQGQKRTREEGANSESREKEKFGFLSHLSLSLLIRALSSFLIPVQEYEAISVAANMYPAESKFAVSTWLNICKAAFVIWVRRGCCVLVF